MKSLLLSLLIISFYFLTNQLVIEEKENNKCANINDNILYNLRTRGQIPNLYKTYYGYNAQNCRLRDSKYDCCYMSVGHITTDEKNKEHVKWYNFCGKVNKEIYNNPDKSFIDAFINDVVYESNKGVFVTKDKKGNDKKYLKIDCFGTKINFVKSIGLALLFLLF